MVYAEQTFVAVRLETSTEQNTHAGSNSKAGECSITETHHYSFLVAPNNPQGFLSCN